MYMEKLQYAVSDFALDDCEWILIAIPERRKKFSSQSNDGEEITPMSDFMLYTNLLWRFDSLSSSRPPPCFYNNLNFSKEKLSDTSHSSAHLFVPLFRCG